MATLSSPRPRRPGWPLGLTVAFTLAAALLLVLPGSVWPAAAVPPNLATSAPPTLTWSSVTTPVAPPPLSNAVAAYDSDNRTIVMFGGRTAGGSLSNETWVWNGSTWTDYQVPSPPAREMASMAFDPQLHQLILFGGLGADGQPLGDTWAWNGASWYQQGTNGPSAQSPGPRQGAAMSSDGNGDLVLFGGWGSPLPPPDSTTTTTPTTAAGSSSTTTVPPASPVSAAGSASAASSASADRIDKASLTDTSGQVLGDTWLWTSAGWIPGPTAGPSPRSEAAMALDTATGQTILMGGRASPSGSATSPALADSWAWSGSAWSKLDPRAAPSARAGAVMADDPLTGGLVLFGGLENQTALGDTWLWNGASWASARTSGAPAARAGAAAAFDGDSRELVVFGGTGAGGATLGGTEILTGQAPLVLAPGQASSSSPPRAGGGGTTSHTPTTRGHGSAGLHSPAAATATSETTTNAPGNGSTTPPSLGATTHRLHRGELVTLSGDGFASYAEITISFHSKPAPVGQTSANKEGHFSVTVAVPESAAAGLHHFMASGESRSGPLEELVAVDVIGVPSGSLPSPLETAVLVALAILMPLGTWCALAAAGWWRRRKPAAI